MGQAGMDVHAGTHDGRTGKEMYIYIIYQVVKIRHLPEACAMPRGHAHRHREKHAYYIYVSSEPLPKYLIHQVRSTRSAVVAQIRSHLTFTYLVSPILDCYSLNATTRNPQLCRSAVALGLLAPGVLCDTG